MKWYVYSLLAAVLLALHFLFLKKTTLLGVPVSTLTFFIWIISSLLLLGYLVFNKQIFTSLSSQAVPFVVITSVAFFAGVLLLNKAVSIAPNPGYATAIGSVQVLLVVVLSALLLGSSFTTLKVFGTILVVAGIILLGI